MQRLLLHGGRGRRLHPDDVAPLLDSVALELLTAPLYTPDGVMRDEVFTYQAALTALRPSTPAAHAAQPPPGRP